MSALLLSSGCHSDKAEQGVEDQPQLPTGHNVAISAVGSVSTKVELDPTNMSDVHWSKGDKIALWAKSSGSNKFLFSAKSFSMFYYGGTYDNAIFTSSINKMAEGEYTYYAAYPLPQKVSEGVATFALSDVQNGYYDGANDIMVSNAVVGEALIDDANVNHPLSFSHLAHAIRVEIPADRDILGNTQKLRITFPQDVVGDAVVDITAEEPAIALSNSGSSILVDFDKNISEAGYVWLFIAPTTLDGEIQFTGINNHNEMSTTITTTVSQRVMEAGMITPITLTIPQGEQPVTSKLRVNSDKLGEKVQKVTLTAPDSGYFAGGDNSIEITADENGEFEFKYIESTQQELFETKGLSVVYESANAIIKGDQIYLKARVDGEEHFVDASTPYLFEETFSSISATNAGLEKDNATIPGCSGWTIGKYAGYWANTSVAIKAHNGGWSTSIANSSLKLSSIATIKSGKKVSLKVVFNADWNKDRCSGMDLKVNDKTIGLSDNSSASQTNIKTGRNVTLSGMQRTSAITWSTSASGANFINGSTEPVYIDNIKITIAQ